MAKSWRLIDNVSCENCGSDVESFTDEKDTDGSPLPPGWAYDGDSCRCVECGCRGTVSCDEESFGIIWCDDIEEGGPQ